MDREILINRLKRTTERRHPGKPYVITEYKKFFTVVVDGTEPFLYEKEDGFPLRLMFGQVSKEETANPKLVYEFGGKKDGKK